MKRIKIQITETTVTQSQNTVVYELPSVEIEFYCHASANIFFQMLSNILNGTTAMLKEEKEFWN